MTLKHLTTSPDITSHGRGTGALRTQRPVYVDLLPPCNHACPAGENIQAWLALTQTGNFEAAWQNLIEHNPLPSVHGRVCYHPCEASCNRGEVDEAVSIHAVERFLGEITTKRIRSGRYARVDDLEGAISQVVSILEGPNTADGIPRANPGTEDAATMRSSTE